MNKHHFSSALLALCALAFFSSPAFGQTVVNSSFETDAVPPAPGYGTISGWTGGSGINDAGGPFANNGTIPDGTKVAFIQFAGTMRQVVSGFTPGLLYRLRYFENARSGTNAPNLQVTVGGVTVVAAHTVTAVGGTNPYTEKTTEPFTATAASLDVAFVVTGTGDFTVLLDKVEIAKSVDVTNASDSGPGSLRQAVLDVPDGGTIRFAAGAEGTVLLTTTLVIDKNMTIIGPGSSKFTLRNVVNGPDNRVFRVLNKTVSISGLTVTGGRTTGVDVPIDQVNPGNGAGILNNGGTLTLTDVTVSDCIATAASGGGIGNFSGTTTLNNCTVANNQALGGTPVLFGLWGGSGGGISVAGTLNVNNSLITGNSCDGRYGRTGFPTGGGGIAPYQNAIVTITNSTISGNVALFGNGGGISVLGTLTLTNSTVSGNEARTPPYCDSVVHSSWGGIYVFDDVYTHVFLRNSVVTDNFSTRARATGCTYTEPVGRTAGLFFESTFQGSDVTLRNSIVAGNSQADIYRSTPVFQPYILSEGYNLIGSVNTAHITGTTTGNIIGAAARLAPLGFYGGAMATHAFLSTSPAINAGNTTNSPASDQRGAARVGVADIGAFELNGPTNAGTFVAILPQGALTLPYSYTLVPKNVAFGSTFTYTVTSGPLPAGITLATQANVVTLSGTPTAAGTFNFAITASDGTLTNATNYRLIVPAAAGPASQTVTAISPSSGNTIGSETVTITGTNFTGATGVSIGGTPVISFTVVSATSITAVSPAHVQGTASVVVSNGGSDSAANTLYTYLPALFTQPQYAGNYTAGQNNVINSPGTFNLYTAAQYTGNYTAGQNSVIASPNTYNLYTLSQIQNLNVGVPLLVKDQATGKFKLNIALKKSTNPATAPFLAFPMNGTGMTSTINAQGTLDFVFPVTDNAAFFRVQAQ